MILILDDGRKVGVISPHVVPKLAICDPELTLGLPSMLTASTGMDAIAHCLERHRARRAVARVAAYRTRDAGRRRSRRALEHDERVDAGRARVPQKGFGCVHSPSHSLGGIDPKLHHGTLNAVFLPAVIAFNRSAPTMAAEGKLERIA